MKRVIKAAAACLLLLAGCSKRPAPGPELPFHADLASYAFRPGSPLEDRIAAVPDKFLAYFSAADGRPDYRAYAPSAADKALLLEYLRLMPPSVERLFRERCAALWFVENFQGNGMTGWVGGRPGETFFFMVLNPDSLRRTLSETLTERERSCFVPARGFGVSVDAGTKYKGLAYALFHEAAHAADYVRGVTPYVEPGIPPEYSPPAKGDGGLFSQVWQDYGRPFPKNEFYLRDKITFYGFGGGPRIEITEAAGAHKLLAASPFVSLYGAKSWAEDFAELVSFGLIAGRLGQPYRVVFEAPGGARTEAAHYDAARRRRAEAALALLEGL